MDLTCLFWSRMIIDHGQIEYRAYIFIHCNDNFSYTFVYLRFKAIIYAFNQGYETYIEQPY